MRFHRNALPWCGAIRFARQTVRATYAKVLLDDSGGRAFDYGIPETLNAVVGSRVRVPVRMRTLLGTIIALSETTEAEGVRMISELVGDEPALSPGLIGLAQWMADYYCCPLEAAMKTVLPNVIRKAGVGTPMSPRLDARFKLNNRGKYSTPVGTGVMRFKFAIS